MSRSFGRWILPILFLVTGSQVLYALNYAEFWEGILRTEKEFDIQDDSPKRRSIFKTDTPKTLIKDALNHKILWFCQKYLEKSTNYPIPRYKTEIRRTLSDFYGDPIGTVGFNRNEFVCYSRNRSNEPQIQITFGFDGTKFLPFKWEYFDAQGFLHLTEEDESKNGKKDSFTKYTNINGLRCPISTEKDRNEIGGPDEWWTYKNCSLAKIEYDANENGYRERVCFFENNRMTFCDGIGEKEEREAVLLEESGKTNAALALYRISLSEYKKEMIVVTPRTCHLLKKIANLEYAERDFSAFNRTLEEFFSSNICESDSLDVLIYKGYYQLYLISDFKSAKQTYSEAIDRYQRTNGESNAELALNLSYSQYMDNDPLSCVSTLESLNPKRLLPLPRFFLFYYRGSCHLDLGNFTDAYEDLKKSLKIGGEKSFLPTVLYKLARVSLLLNKESEGHLYMSQGLLGDIRLFSTIENDPVFQSYLETTSGKTFRSKYYLNKPKNP